MAFSDIYERLSKGDGGSLHTTTTKTDRFDKFNLRWTQFWSESQLCLNILKKLDQPGPI